MKMNVTRQVGPDGVMTDIFEVVDKNKGNNVGREEQIALMLLTRGLVRGRRATARSKVIPLEDGQKREALNPGQDGAAAQAARGCGGRGGRAAFERVSARCVCVLVLWGGGSD